MKTQEYDEGYAAAITGAPRNSNPFARGWSRWAALVMPGSFAEEWDNGWVAGCEALAILAKAVRAAAHKGEKP